MDKKLYIHIGLPKTASTTIQASMIENESGLLKKGILYPKVGRRFAHHEIGYQVIENPRYNPENGDLKQLADEISRSEANKVVISAEMLSCANTDQVRTLKNALQPYTDITIIIFLRRQDLWLQSLWNQLSKSGFINTNFETFIENAFQQKPENTNSPLENYVLLLSNPDFASRIQPWEEVFGQEHIVVRVLEKQQIRENVFHEFLSIVGITDPTSHSTVNKNISPSAKTLELIRFFVQRLGCSALSNSLTIEQLAPYCVQSLADKLGWNNEKFNAISQETYAKITTRCALSNTAIAKTYFDNDQLFLEEYSPRPITTFNVNILPLSEALELSAYMFRVLGNNKQFVTSIIKKNTQGRSTLPESKTREEILKKLRQQNQQLKKELNAIKNTKTWKFIRFLRKALGLSVAEIEILSQ